MLTNHRTASLLVFCSALLAGASLNAQNIVYQENWGEYTLGDSVITGAGSTGYRWAVEPVSGTTAVIGGTNAKKFLSVKSVGFSGAGNNPYVVANAVSPATPVSLTSGLDTTISLDVRMRNPDAQQQGNGYMITEIYTNGSASSANTRLAFGIYSTGRFFFRAPGMSDANYSPTNVTAVVTDWYRLKLDLDANSNDIVFSAFSLDGNGAESLVWSIAASSLIEGFEYEVTSLSTIRYIVTKPGTGAEVGGIPNAVTSDFGDFTVTQVPEPATIAALLGAGALAVAFVVRRRRRHEG